MSKYILDIGRYHEHTLNCSCCSAIDRQYNIVLALQSDLPRQNAQFLFELKNLEKMLVNGYGLLDVYEANNMVNHPTKSYVYTKLMEMPSHTDDVVNRAISTFTEQSVPYNQFISYNPTLIFSRFCKECGARKPDIFDTECLKDFRNLYFNAEYTDGKVILSWNDIDYDFPHSYKLYKKADTDDDYTLIDEPIETQYTDRDLGDGRAYYYRLEHINERNEVIKTLENNILVPCSVDHTPLPLQDLKFIKHRYLDENLSQHDYIYAQYVVDEKDKDFHDVIFKVNSEHVPSHEYWMHDIVFKNHDGFVFPDSNKYFFKAFLKSKRFKKDWICDHHVYPDLYYWYNDTNPLYMEYTDFDNDLFDLTFDDDIRSMTIKYKLKVYTTVKYVRIMFAQSNSYIHDNDAAYKIVDIPVDHAMYEYTIKITNLASNSHWVFGVFPVYENTDPDIRLEYQHIAKIRPYYNDDEYYNRPEDFYDIGKWYYDYDFSRYDLKDNSKQMLTDEKVMMCDGLNKKEVSALLIHNVNCAEKFTVSYDVKMITKNLSDRMHTFTNHKPQMRISTTDAKWVHFERTFYNKDYVFLRWEQMKMSDMPWTCTFVKNVHIHNYQTIDDKTDNFTVTIHVGFYDYKYYTRRIKHDDLYQHTPRKKMLVEVKMNQYYEEQDEKEVITIGKCIDKFDWLP